MEKLTCGPRFFGVGEPLIQRQRDQGVDPAACLELVRGLGCNAFRSWMHLTEGLKDLTEVQIRIIELVFFEGMCPADVRRIMEMSLKEIRIEVRSIRKTLSKVM